MTLSRKSEKSTSHRSATVLMEVADALELENADVPVRFPVWDRSLHNSVNQ